MRCLTYQQNANALWNAQHRHALVICLEIVFPYFHAQGNIPPCFGHKRHMQFVTPARRHIGNILTNAPIIQKYLHRHIASTCHTIIDQFDPQRGRTSDLWGSGGNLPNADIGNLRRPLKNDVHRYIVQIRQCIGQIHPSVRRAIRYKIQLAIRHLRFGQMRQGQRQARLKICTARSGL